MLVIVSCVDQALLTAKTKEILKKINPTSLEVVYHDAPTVSLLQELGNAQDLFGGVSVHVLRELEAEAEDFLFSHLNVFKNSLNVFIAQVTKVLKKQNDACVKEGVEVIQVKSLVKKEMPSFVLADAFLRRDKKAVFVALHEELATKPPEEVHGGLWYQIKNMALIFSGANESESGLHPFVYKKLKSATTKFSKKECDGMLKELLEMSHKAHRGELDFEVALEQFVLKYT